MSWWGGRRKKNDKKDADEARWSSGPSFSALWQPTSLPWGSLIRSMLCTKWSSFSTLCTSNDVYLHPSEQLSSHLGSCQSATHVQKLVDGSIEMQHRQCAQTFCSQQTHQMLRLRDTSIKWTRQGVVFFYGSILQYHTIAGHLPAILILELYQQHPRSPHSVAGCRNLHPAEARPLRQRFHLWTLSAQPQGQFQDPKMKVPYHTGPYFVRIPLHRLI